MTEPSVLPTRSSSSPSTPAPAAAATSNRRELATKAFDRQPRQQQPTQYRMATTTTIIPVGLTMADLQLPNCTEHVTGTWPTTKPRLSRRLRPSAPHQQTPPTPTSRAPATASAKAMAAMVSACWLTALTVLLLLAGGAQAASQASAANKSGAANWPVTKCSMSEFTCTNGKCVQLNKFCDNTNDCGDGSDEPRFCTRCNRTYYGNLGITYDLELHRPKEDKIPYVCELNFTAAGGQHGDIIQITLESFTLGRFVSYTVDGCPDGHLQIAEASRAPVGGMWCGSAWGPVVFYSETRTLILTVKLYKLSKDQSGYNFDFRLLYKVLPRETAVVRFGGIRREEFIPWLNTSLLQPLTSIAAAPIAADPTMTGISSDPVAASMSATSAGLADGFTNLTAAAHSDHLTAAAVAAAALAPATSAVADDQQQQQQQLQKQQQQLLQAAYRDDSAQRIHQSQLQYSRSLAASAANYTEPKYYLGSLISGTYCSRIFSDCDKNVCRLQSPNYPGVYPRNLTCYYAVRQHDVPPGKHALITVRQPKGNLVWVQTQNSAAAGNGAKQNDKEKFQPRISTWDECDSVQDYVTIYDGYTTRDPVILKFCGGGQGVPAAVSSGPELLVEFTTSPFGTFLTSPSSVHNLNGFQLEVEVTFVDQQSFTYVKTKRKCEFWLRGTGHGVLESPRHSLGPNNTCLYHLMGTEVTYQPIDQLHMPRRPTSRFKVWLSVLKFDLAPRFGVIEEPVIGQLQQPEDCDGMLRIWDGPMREAPSCADYNCERDANNKPIVARYGQNLTTLMARYCQGRVPRSCDHGALNDNSTRPCTLSESFVSSGDLVTLELKNTDTTALRPLRFKLRYEFIDFLQDGQPLNGAVATTSDHEQHDCDRRFVSAQLPPDKRDVRTFRSTRNIFLFGRGGRANLSCRYRFEAQRDERVRLVIKRVSTGRRHCFSKIDLDTNRSYCFGDTRTRVEIRERHTAESAPVRFHRSCLCNGTNSTDAPHVFTSTGREVEVLLLAYNMTANDDQDGTYFEATYEFIPGPYACKESRDWIGTSGTASLSAEEIECRTRPWYLEPSPQRYLYVRMHGIYLRKHSSPDRPDFNVRTHLAHMCETKSRVILTNADGTTVTACPLSRNSARDDVVEMFSAGWQTRDQFEQPPQSRAISVEFINPDHEDYVFAWLEMEPRRTAHLRALDSAGADAGAGATATAVWLDCPYRCPELDVCVNASVWCDGVVHCPSGTDESFAYCSAILRLPAEILASICVVMLLCCGGLLTYLYRRIRRHCRGSSILQTRLKSLSSMDTAAFDEKDVIS